MASNKRSIEVIKKEYPVTKTYKYHLNGVSMDMLLRNDISAEMEAALVIGQNFVADLTADLEEFKARKKNAK